MTQNIITLYDAVRRHANGPSSEAVRSEADRVSYASLLELAGQTADHLTLRGVGPGHGVLIDVSGIIEHTVAVLASMRIGAIAIPVHKPTPQRLDDIIALCRPRLCIADDLAAASLETIPVDIVSFARDIAGARMAVEPATAPVRSASGSLGRDPAFVRFTSGSTGEPKGVVISHRQQHVAMQNLISRFGIGSQHRELVLAPVALSGAWQRVAATLYAGGCVVAGEAPASPSRVLQRMHDRGITGFYTSPPLLRTLLAASEAELESGLTSCRIIEVGSASVRPQELERLRAHAPDADLFVHYGLTECSRATLLHVNAHPERIGTVGRPVAGVKIAIRGEDGRGLAVGDTGEIHVTGPQLASGYWKRPELTAERFRGGWFATGDFGHLDEEGFLVFSGRRDDRICASGYKFYPDEVESALGVLPGAARYLVAPVPTALGIEQNETWLFVEPKPGREWSNGAALRLLRQRLPSHMVPKRIVVVQELPLTSAGKPDRRATVERYRSRGGATAESDGRAAR